MKKIVALLLLISMLSTLFVSCAKKETHSRSLFLMDTVITVTLYTKDSELATRELDACEALLEELNGLWSRHERGSDVSRLNSSSGTVTGLDARTVLLLKKACEISRATNGCFDITLAPITDLWETCAKEERLPSDFELLAARMKTGYSTLGFPSDGAVEKPLGIQIDLGGIGKGAAISYLLEHLSASDVPAGLVTFGSNVAVFGEKPSQDPFRVALRDPKDSHATVGTITLSDGEFLSVSGDYERYVTIHGENYHHIIDPSTGKPSSSGLSSVAVICSDGALSDALSTALLVMGTEKALTLYSAGTYDFEAILISSDGKITTTSGLDDQFVVTQAAHDHQH